MKYICLPLICIMFMSLLQSQAQTMDKEMENLLYSGDYIELNRRYEIARERGKIYSSNLKRTIEAVLYTSHNKPKKAAATWKKIINYNYNGWTTKNKFGAISQLASNLCSMGNYKEASDRMLTLLVQTANSKELKMGDRIRMEQTCNLRVFGNKFAPKISRPKRDCKVALLSKNGWPHLFIPVTLNGKEYPFLFDSGCSAYSTNFASEEFAREHNIRILGELVTAYGVGGAEMQKLGMLDTLRIGDIIYRNVAFTIYSGQHLGVDAGLGLGFMKAMGEIQIYLQEKKIVFPSAETPLPATGSNMMLNDGGSLFVEAYSNNERLIFMFDTGASSFLSDSYYQKHAADSLDAGLLKMTTTMSGFGGTRESRVFDIPSFPIKVGTVNHTMINMSVFTDRIIGATSQFDGLLGSDYVRMCRKVTVNFNKMFMTVE
ncbi:MAG: retroviral-like aspartic protease family protein [Bacteroidales bacterium]|nr:retroviral-like aspartic protease family protein [Bacteroidales bacterium]